MKKTYIAPQAEVIKVTCASLLSGSPKTSGLTDFGGYKGDDSEGYDPD